MLLVPQGDSSLLAVETKKNMSTADDKSNQKALHALNLLGECAMSRTSVSHMDTVHRHFKEKNSLHSVCEGMCSLQRNSVKQNNADYNNTLSAPVKYNSSRYLDLVKKAPVFVFLPLPLSLNFCGRLLKA